MKNRQVYMPKRKKSSNKNVPQARLQPSRPSALPLGVLAGVALIIVLVFLAYLPSLSGGFIWDDNLLLTKNELIKSPDGLYRFWCTTQSYDYWPLTYTTFWLEWRLWGLHSTGYHVTNLILHIVESLLIWLILRKLSIPGAFLAAMIFAVHPVNVESVAWIAQRKNLMAMLFFLLSILCYLESIKRAPLRIAAKHTVYRPLSTFSSFILHPSSFKLWYRLSLLTFLLALLSKGSVAVLPVLLLGIIWWLRPLTKWDLVRTVPFFVVALAFTAVNIWFQTLGETEVIRTATFAQRLLGAGGVIWFYLYKALLPFDLIFVYPQWHIQAGYLLWWTPLLAAVTVTAVLWLYRKSWSRPFLFAWGFFCVALVPVMGFTDVYFMKYSLVADHYQHIALVGVIALVAALWSIWHQRFQGAAQWAATIVPIAVVGSLTFLTWQQSGHYRDEITLYQATLQKNPNCWLAYNNLGALLEMTGRSQEAMEHFKQALRLKPDYADAHNNLGLLLDKAGRGREAIEQWEQALQQNLDYFDAHYNLGLALAQTGRAQEAIELFKQALRIRPDDVETHNNLGIALAKTGQVKEAIEQYNQALRLKPDYFKAHYNLGNALAIIGRPQEAIEQYEQTLRLKPDYTEAYANLAIDYAQANRSSEAIATAKKGLELARSKNQTALAKQLEDWLNSYRASLKDLPNESAPPKSAVQPH